MVEILMFAFTRYASSTSSRSFRKRIDGRKVIAAIPFLAVGCLVFAYGLNWWFTYGDLEIQRCYDDGTGKNKKLPQCQPMTYTDLARFDAILSVPFLAIGTYLLAFGLNKRSLVSLKKESVDKLSKTSLYLS